MKRPPLSKYIKKRLAKFTKKEKLNVTLIEAIRKLREKTNKLEKKIDAWDLNLSLLKNNMTRVNQEVVLIRRTIEANQIFVWNDPAFKYYREDYEKRAQKQRGEIK